VAHLATNQTAPKPLKRGGWVSTPTSFSPQSNKYNVGLNLTNLRARLAQLQLLILSEDLEEPCQTGIFFKLILV
jgi:hypothetical protein